jgi:NAD(P)-dependent dehydrogenase (short-subunit alcohol dehydrogenase family)
MAQAKKVALITGANKGIGFEVARQIARAGWTVLVGARNEELGKQAAEKLKGEGLDAHFVHVDLDAHETAAIAAEGIDGQFGKLDVLINNAGIVGAGDGPPSKVDIQALTKVMNTNYVGSVVVTQAMLPLLQKAGKAQVINVSSGLGCISLQTDTSWPYAPVKVLGYCSSKAAMNMFTVQLAYEFRDGSIAVNSVNPGYTATDLNGHSGHQTIEEGAAEIVRVALLDTPPTGKFLETGAEHPW